MPPLNQQKDVMLKLKQAQAQAQARTQCSLGHQEGIQTHVWEAPLLERGESQISK